MQVRGAILLAVLGALNLSSFPSLQMPAADARFVARRGQQLVKDGKPLRFVGVNCYGLAQCPERADEIFGVLAAHGVRVVRFWAFQTYCGPTGRDFSAFDALIAGAKRHDILLLPVLENHWKHCTFSEGHEWKPREWYESGWRTDAFADAPLSYRDYVRAIGERYRDEPQILAWQLVNEPEIYPDTDENFSVLRAFAEQVARELREVAPHQLISLGLLGIGQPSTTGEKFRALHNFRGIDVVSAHDYGYVNDPLPGRSWGKRENSFYANLTDARSLQKPFLATEAGMPLSWFKNDRAHRAELLRAKLQAFFKADGSGYILWHYDPAPDTDYGFGPDDPIMQAIADVAALL
jgi:mannan endo-1,4-beta-mannosidase